MHRRIFLQNSLLSFGALSVSKSSLIAGLRLEPWKISMLSDDVGIFTEKGGTIAFHYSKEGITVVDAQFPDSANHLITELLKRKQLPFRLLINTHHHGDHSSGNIAFKKHVARVLAHENSLANQKRVAAERNTEDKQLYPTQTFEDEFTEKVGNEIIGLYYFGPAHTDGDAVIHFKHANIAHMGDLVFNRRHPFVDRGSGASLKNWMEVLNNTVKKLDKETKYVFGHAAPGFEVTGDSSALLLFRDYIGNTLELVSSEMKAGKTKEDILSVTEIPGSPEWKGDGIKRVLEAAYEELLSLK